jgi:hypothetical protein
MRLRTDCQGMGIMAPLSGAVRWLLVGPGAALSPPPRAKPDHNNRGADSLPTQRAAWPRKLGCERENQIVPGGPRRQAVMYVVPIPNSVVALCDSVAPGGSRLSQVCRVEGVLGQSCSRDQRQAGPGGFGMRGVSFPSLFVLGKNRSQNPPTPPLPSVITHSAPVLNPPGPAWRTSWG